MFESKGKTVNIHSFSVEVGYIRNLHCTSSGSDARLCINHQYSFLRAQEAAWGKNRECSLVVLTLIADARRVGSISQMDQSSIFHLFKKRNCTVHISREQINR